MSAMPTGVFNGHITWNKASGLFDSARFHTAFDKGMFDINPSVKNRYLYGSVVLYRALCLRDMFLYCGLQLGHPFIREDGAMAGSVIRQIT